MTDLPAGYLLDVPYVPQFHREHAPIWLRACLAALGQADGQHTATSQPVWCEVGCGPAVGLLILAATNPNVRFIGIDINPEHIDAAKRLAEDAGIGNVEFHCKDLREDIGLPAVDFLIVRGLYSWVSPDVRQAVRELAGQHLKPGGVALLHYLTLPGAADLTVFHGLFSALHLQPGTHALDAVQRGRDLIAGLRKGKAGFFATHPVAENYAQATAADDAAYTAHDYLNTYFTPLTVAQVMHDMGGVGLALAGNASPLDNLDDFTVPESLRGLLNAQKDRGTRELVRDMACNQQARLDLYRRDIAPLAADKHFAALRQLLFTALPGAPAGGGVTFETRIGRIEGHASIFSPVLEALAARQTVSYAELEQLPVMKGRPGLVNQTLHALMGAGAIHPVPERAPDGAAARRLNAVLIRRHTEGKRVPALAAPGIGSGLEVPTPLLDRLASGKPASGAWTRLLG